MKMVGKRENRRTNYEFTRGTKSVERTYWSDFRPDKLAQLVEE